MQNESEACVPNPGSWPKIWALLQSISGVRVSEENKCSTRSARTIVRAKNSARTLRIRRIVSRREQGVG